MWFMCLEDGVQYRHSNLMPRQSESPAFRWHSQRRSEPRFHGMQTAGAQDPVAWADAVRKAVYEQTGHCWSRQQWHDLQHLGRLRLPLCLCPSFTGMVSNSRTDLFVFLVKVAWSIWAGTQKDALAASVLDPHNWWQSWRQRQAQGCLEEVIVQSVKWFKHLMNASLSRSLASKRTLIVQLMLLWRLITGPKSWWSLPRDDPQDLPGPPTNQIMLQSVSLLQLIATAHCYSSLMFIRALCNSL